MSLSHCIHQSLNIFSFNDTATTEIYTLSLHDALPIYYGIAYREQPGVGALYQEVFGTDTTFLKTSRSEEHTSELQSRRDLVCRLLLEKKKNLSHFIHQTLNSKTSTRLHSGGLQQSCTL